MPIYEYRCDGCGNRLEAFQRMADAPLVECPACGQPALTKLVSAAGFRLKGGGWYETDFKGTGRKRNLAQDAESTGGGKAETGKAAAKAETGAAASSDKTKTAPSAAGSDS